MENELRLGILGCGTICQAGHIIAAEKAKNVRIEALCDVAPDLLERMSVRCGCEKTYSDYADMLADSDIDAVVIGIADQFHVERAVQALEAGKHVLVEKPMGISTEECARLVETAKKTGLTVQVGNMKRFDEGIAFARDFIRTGLGELSLFKGWYCDSSDRYTVTDNVMPVLYKSERSRRPAGDPKADRERYYLLGHGSHLVDTARYLCGEIISLRAEVSVRGDMYSWMIMPEFAAGGVAQLNLTVAVKGSWHEGFEAFGTKGSVKAKTYNPWEFRSTEAECFSLESGLFTRPIASDGQVYRRQLEGFADVILNKSEQTGANAEDGEAAVRALMAIYESSHRNAERIALCDVYGEL